MSGQGWVIASSALFFVPAAISVFRQSLLITLIFAATALFSTLYHASNETKYEEIDVFFACLSIILSLVMLALIAIHYAPWSWRVLLPVIFGAVGMIVYFLEGQASPDHSDLGDHYELYHSLWHLFIAIAGTILVWTPVNLGETSLSYSELYLKMKKNLFA